MELYLIHMSKYEQIQNCSIAKDKFLIQFIDLSIDISKYEMLLLLHTNIIKWRRTKIKIYVAVGVFFLLLSTYDFLY